MNQQQITPWSFYRGKSNSLPRKSQQLPQKKKSHGKLNLPYINNCIQTAAISEKLQEKQMQFRKMISRSQKDPHINLIVKRFVSKHKEISDIAANSRKLQQQVKANETNKLTQQFNSQIENSLVLVVVYELIKETVQHQNEMANQQNVRQSIQPNKEIENSSMIPIISMKGSTNINPNFEQLPQTRNQRIHNSNIEINKSKIRDILNREINAKIMNRMKFLWKGREQIKNDNN